MSSRLLPEATSAMRAGDLGRAYDLFIQAGGTEGYANAGICAAQMGRFTEAANAFELASKSDPRDPQLRRYFGLSCQDSGRNEDAYRVLAEFADPDSLLARGKAALLTGRLKDAETCFRKCLQARPQWPVAWVNLGLTHLQSASNEAEAAFDRALRIDANYLPAIENLAHLWQTSGRATDAIRLYERAIRLAPNDATLWLAKGQAEQLSQQFNAALASYEKVASLAPDQPASTLNRAQILGERGDYGDAIQALNFITPTSPAAHLAAWRKALLMPIIPDSVEEIDAAR
jgi:tetratricopeptide (TPR) repeat protein